MHDRKKYIDMGIDVSVFSSPLNMTLTKSLSLYKPQVPLL